MIVRQMQDKNMAVQLSHCISCCCSSRFCFLHLNVDCHYGKISSSLFIHAVILPDNRHCANEAVLWVLSNKIDSWRRWDNADSAGVHCKCCLEAWWQFQVTLKWDEPLGKIWGELRGMFVRTCTELLLFGMCLCASVCAWTLAFQHVGVTSWVRLVCLCIGLYVCLLVHVRVSTCWWCLSRTAQSLWPAH